MADAPHETYLGMREMVLDLDPDLVDAPADARVLAVVMETGFDDGSYTLVALADGTTSLYLSNGGGIIGAGKHPAVAALASDLTERAAAFLEHARETEGLPLPGEGRTRIWFVTRDDVRSVEAEEVALGEGEHAASDLFHACHDLLGAVRAHAST